MVISDEEKVAVGVGMLIDSRFSQLPVRNAKGKIVGMFSYRSLVAKHHAVRERNINFSNLQLGAFLEPAKFIAPDEYIDTSKAADFRDDDYVLVGSPDQILGILTVSDVFQRLNEFAESFVLLHEIEIGIRELVSRVLDQEQLNLAFEQINIKRCAGQNGRQVSSIEDCQFSDYRRLITGRGSWPNFQNAFRLFTRELIDAEMDHINSIRNDVFHFRRKVLHSDVIYLRDFRNRLMTANDISRLA